MEVLEAASALKPRHDLPVDFCQQSNTLGLFTDGADNIWIVGKELVLYSEDRGTTWKNQFEATEPRIDLALSGSARPGGLAWMTVANFDIFVTKDYGQHWKRTLATDDINLDAISFYSDTNGCAAGNADVIYCSTDGGHTWEPRKVFSAIRTEENPYGANKGIRKFVFTAPGIAWALSWDGKLFKTEDDAHSFVAVVPVSR